jgi:hypothetical protein
LNKLHTLFDVFPLWPTCNSRAACRMSSRAAADLAQATAPPPCGYGVASPLCLSPLWIKRI